MESYDHHKSASQIFHKACGYGSHRIVCCPELPLPPILDVHADVHAATENVPGW
jgi:hypothetical protein